MWETWVRSLGWEDPLEKGKATHSNILAWRITWSTKMLHPKVTLTTLAAHGPSPGLHPAFGPERFDLGIQKRLHIVLPGLGLALLHVKALQFDLHHLTEQLPAEWAEVTTFKPPQMVLQGFNHVLSAALIKEKILTFIRNTGTRSDTGPTNPPLRQGPSLGTPDFITPLELLPGSHYPPAPLLLIFLLIRTDSLLLVLLLFQHPREWEGLGGTPRSPQTHFLLPTVPSPTTHKDFSEEMRMLKAARGTHLLGDLGLCVGLALVLVLGHLLRHGPANGFLKLLERFLQTPTLLRASPVMSLVYAEDVTFYTEDTL